MLSRIGNWQSKDFPFRLKKMRHCFLHNNLAEENIAEVLWVIESKTTLILHKNQHSQMKSETAVNRRNNDYLPT